MVKVLALAFALALAGIAGAAAQVPGQYDPSAAFPAPILPPTPPAAQPGMAPPPPLIGTSSRSRPPKVIPGIEVGRAARPSFGDRASGCAHQAAASGVPAGSVLQYQRQCVDGR